MRDAPPPEFEAIITPHRSLSAAGLRRLVAVLLLMSASLSTGLWLIGAWPVVAFNGAEMLLALVLLHRNHTARRSTERLLLTGSELTVLRTDRAGRERRRVLDSAWLQAVVHERPGRTPALLLVERGHQLEVGAELGEAEKRDLAEALRAALFRSCLRHPVFENPQIDAGPPSTARRACAPRRRAPASWPARRPRSPAGRR